MEMKSQFGMSERSAKENHRQGGRECFFTALLSLLPPKIHGTLTEVVREVQSDRIALQERHRGGAEIHCCCCCCVLEAGSCWGVFFKEEEEDGQRMRKDAPERERKVWKRRSALFLDKEQGDGLC